MTGGVFDVAHSLRGEGFDASEDGTGRGTPLVPVAFDCKGTEVQYAIDGSHPTLRSMAHNASHQNAGGHAAVAIQERAICENPNAGPDGAGVKQDGTSYTLEARATQQAVAFAENQRGEVRVSDAAMQLTTGGGKPGQGYPAVAFDLRGREGGSMPEGPPDAPGLGKVCPRSMRGGRGAVFV